MKTLSCKDIAKGETEEDVMKDAVQHGMKEHGKTEQDMNQIKDNLRGAIRTSSRILS
jgi:predicted small metal-binding protein